MEDFISTLYSVVHLHCQTLQQIYQILLKLKIILFIINYYPSMPRFTYWLLSPVNALLFYVLSEPPLSWPSATVTSTNVMSRIWLCWVDYTSHGFVLSVISAIPRFHRLVLKRIFNNLIFKNLEFRQKYQRPGLLFVQLHKYNNRPTNTVIKISEQLHGQ